jgi:hypothetical protein
MSNQGNRFTTPLRTSLENYSSFKKETQASSVYHHRYPSDNNDKHSQGSFPTLFEEGLLPQDKASNVLRQKTEYRIMPDDSKPDFQDIVTLEDEGLGRNQDD